MEEGAWLINLPYSAYAEGGGTRHEIGHAVRAAIHGRKDADKYCDSYNYRNEGQHWEKTCEYASAATNEGMATFFGVRSIATSESSGNGAWFCFCRNDDNSNQDVCSETAVAPPGNDKNGFCAGPPDFPPHGTNDPHRGFYGVGDTFANDVTDCTRLRRTSSSVGCNCTDSNGDGECDGTWYQDNGWRNETQVVRFLWDVIDSNNDSGSNDNTDMSIAGLVANLEGMPCTDDGGYAQDGNCNEPHRDSTQNCNPSTDGADITSHTTGDRDSYNAKDLTNDSIIPGDQDDERVLNCVEGDIDVSGP